MLKDELMKIGVANDTPFEEEGIILLSTTDGTLCKIAFGDGSNMDFDDDEGVCDDYMWLEKDAYNEDGELVDGIDGGQLGICRKDYTGFINDEKLIRDCLRFMDYGDDEIEKMVLVRRIRH